MLYATADLGHRAGKGTVYVIVGTVIAALAFKTASSALTLKLLAPLTRLTEADQLADVSPATSSAYVVPPSDEIQILSPEILVPFNITEFVLAVADGGVTANTVYVIVGIVIAALEFKTLSSALILKLLAPLTRSTEADQSVEVSPATSSVYVVPPSDEIQILSPEILVPLKRREGLLVTVVGGCVTEGGDAVVSNGKRSCWTRMDAPGSPEILESGV